MVSLFTLHHNNESLAKWVINHATDLTYYDLKPEHLTNVKKEKKNDDID